MAEQAFGRSPSACSAAALSDEARGLLRPSVGADSLLIGNENTPTAHLQMFAARKTPVRDQYLPHSAMLSRSSLTAASEVGRGEIQRSQANHSAAVETTCVVRSGWLTHAVAYLHRQTDTSGQMSPCPRSLLGPQVSSCGLSPL